MRRAVVMAALGLATLGVVAAATPASAADDRVSVRSVRSFEPGGDGGSVVVSVTKRTKGCVAVRTVLGIQLAGLGAGQVRVEAQALGGWQDVGVSGGDGGVATGAVVPQRQRICDRQTATVRYRVAFSAGTEGGSGTFVGEALTASGTFLGGDSAEFRLAGAPKKSKSPSPSPSTPEPRTSTEAPATGAPVAAAAAPSVGIVGEGGGSGGPSGTDIGLMVGGLGLVALGGALLFFIVRRFRSEKDPDPPAADATAILPTVRPAVADAPTMIIRRVEER